MSGEIPAGKTATIYALCDGRESDPVKRVRYIGQTVRTLAQRLRRHAADARRGEQTRRARWMRSVWATGGHVLIEAVIVVPSSAWGTAEQEQIATLRARGCDLTNLTDGGEGMPNPAPETRAKLSAKSRGNRRALGYRHTPGALVKIGQASRRNKHATGWHHSLEARARIAAALVGNTHSSGIKHTTERNAAKAERQRGERSHYAKLTWPTVISIRERYARGGVTQYALAHELGMSQHAISAIVRGETWATA